MAGIYAGDNPYILANPAIQMWEWLDAKLTLLGMSSLISEARERFRLLSEAEESENLAHHISGLANAEPGSDAAKRHAAALVPHIEKHLSGKALRTAKKVLGGGKEDPRHHALGALFMPVNKESGKVSHIQDIARDLHANHLAKGSGAGEISSHFRKALHARAKRIMGWEDEKKARQRSYGETDLPTIKSSEGDLTHSADVADLGRVGQRATVTGGMVKRRDPVTGKLKSIPMKDVHPEFAADRKMYRELHRAMKTGKSGEHYELGEKKYGLSRNQVDHLLTYGTPGAVIRMGPTRAPLSRLKSQGPDEKVAQDELKRKRASLRQDAAADFKGTDQAKMIARELAKPGALEEPQNVIAKRLGVSPSAVTKAKQAYQKHLAAKGETLKPDYEPPPIPRRKEPGPKYPKPIPLPHFAKSQLAIKKIAAQARAEREAPKDTPEQKREREQRQAAGEMTAKVLSNPSREAIRKQEKSNPVARKAPPRDQGRATFEANMMGESMAARTGILAKPRRLSLAERVFC